MAANPKTTFSQNLAAAQRRSDFIARFGADNGLTYFRGGLTLEEATWANAKALEQPKPTTFAANFLQAGRKRSAN